MSASASASASGDRVRSEGVEEGVEEMESSREVVEPRDKQLW